MNYRNDLPHIVFPKASENIPFTTPGQVRRRPEFPERSRETHAKKLAREFESAWTNFESTTLAVKESRKGVFIEFQSAPGFELPLKNLEELRGRENHIRLCNVRKLPREVAEALTERSNREIQQTATVYIPNAKREYFLKKITEYLEKETIKGAPKNLPLISSIESIKSAISVDSFWADDRDLIPTNTPIWCEVWIRVDQQDDSVKFNDLLAKLGIDVKPGSIKFPERVVKIVLANYDQLQLLILHSDHIAEFRRSKETANFWLGQQNSAQADWVADLSSRLDIDRESLVSVCLLDTGVNNGHPLLSGVIDIVDCASINSKWGVNDGVGHGTNMAGIAIYGNLEQLFQTSSRISINHILESVKLLERRSPNPIDLWGDLTAQAVALPEIQAPSRKRIFCLAATANDARDRGRPSSWSGAIDNLCSGSDGTDKRLFILCAGNPRDRNNVHRYPDIQILDPIHDPAQSWNAVTVGAFTQLANITDPRFNGYQPVAQINQLSPFTTTSLTWDDAWPIKPDIVMEGGNAAIGGDDFPWECDDLSLITTGRDFSSSHFENFCMTSAASALAGNLAAKIQAKYPDYWPETIRALMIHSATWPDELKSQFVEDDSKSQIKRLMKVCGYGVPSYEKAIKCASNSVTIVAESEFQPYIRTDKGIHTNDMHLYRLPWPVQILQDLGEASAEMRITLSYFIEPGPGEIGWKDRYRYQSHSLKFELNNPLEDEASFIQRINAAARDDDDDHSRTESPHTHWVIGANTRNKGSIHSDIWRGTAAQLASSNLISISPKIGWWKERKHLNKFESITRYALIVSITTPDNAVDIYTPIAQDIQVGIAIPIEIDR